MENKNLFIPSTLTKNTLGGSFRCRLDSSLTIIDAKDSFYCFIGYTQNEFQDLFSNKLSAVIYGDEINTINSSIKEQLAKGNTLSHKSRLICKDGSIKWIWVHAELIENQEDLPFLYCIFVDISIQQLFQEQLSINEQQNKFMLSKPQDVVFEWNYQTKEIFYISNFKNKFDFDPPLKNFPQEAVSIIHPDDVKFFLDLFSQYHHGAHTATGEFRIASLNNDYIWCCLCSAGVFDDDGNLQKVFGMIYDVEKYKQQTFHDQLTGLYNQSAAENLICPKLDNVRSKSALVIIDIDNFKHLNDTLGHIHGDVVLTEISHRLKKASPNKNIIGRMGGDEFIVFIPELDDMESLTPIIEDILDTLNQPLSEEDSQNPISVSIGISLYPEDGLSYLDLYKKADQAMLYSKKHGKNQFAFYSSTIASEPSPPTTTQSLFPDNITSGNKLTENTDEYIFQMLYDEPNVNQTVHTLLELIGKGMNLSRIFIFEISDDKTLFEGTFEWCNVGIPSLQDSCSLLSVDGRNDSFLKTNENNNYICPNVSLLPAGKEKDWLFKRGTKSTMISKIHTHDGLFALIGFENCVSSYNFSQQEYNKLNTLSHTIGFFLDKDKETNKEIVSEQSFIKAFLRNQSSNVYGVDLNTYKFFYVDENAVNKLYNAKIGEFCYKAFEGLDEPCKDCLLQKISPQNNPVVVKEVCHASIGKWTRDYGTFLKWDNENRTCLITCHDITGFRTDATLFDLLDSSIPGGMIGAYLEDNLPFYFINQLMLDYLGYSSKSEFLDDIHGSIINSIHPQERDRVKKSVLAQLKKSNEYEVFCRMRKKDRNYIQTFEKGKQILAENGKKAIVSVCIDISTQNNLQKQISLYRAAERGGVFTVKLDKYFTLVHGNDIFYQIHGYTPETMKSEIQNQCSRCLIPKEVKSIRKMILESIREGKNSLEWEMQIITRSKDIRHVLVTAAFTDLDEEPLLDGLLIDVTQEYKLKDKISKSEERYKIALEYANINIWEYDLKSQRLIVCGLSKRFNFLPNTAENVPESLIEGGYVHPDSIDDYRKLYNQILSGESNGAADIHFKVKGEDRYWWERITYTIIFDKRGNPLRAIEIGEDVTIQKESEIKYQQELQIRQESMRDIIASSKANLSKNKIEFLQVIAYELDYQNITYEEMFDIGLNTIANSADKEQYISKMSIASLTESYNRGDRVVSVEYRRKDAQGLLVWVLGRVNLVVDAMNGDLYAYGTIRNINEQKNIELSLRQRAERDFLTGAYNYETSFSMMEEALEKSRKNNDYYSLFLFNIINLSGLLGFKKRMRDDDLLCELYSTIQSSFGNNKIIGRLGSDVFAVCVIGNINKTHLRQEAEKIHDEFCSTYSLQNQDSLVSLLIGYTFSQADDSFADIYSRAEIALGMAKSDTLDYCIEYNEGITEPTHAFPQILSSVTSNELDAALLKCALSIISGQKIDVVIKSILQAVGEYYRAEEVCILETSDLNFCSANIYEWIADNSDMQSFVGISPAEYETLLKTICYEKSSPIMDISVLKERFPFEYTGLARRQIRSLSVMEIEPGDGVIGYLIVVNTKTHIENNNLLTSIVNFIAGELTKRRLREKQIYMQHHDSLTGLLNRNSYLTYRAELVEESLISMGVASFDINGLKQMNSRYGYSYGDRVIQFTGKLLKEKLGKIGLVYRFAGDEFLAICENITREAFAHFIYEIKEEAERCFPCSLSIGYTWSDMDIELNSLITHADERMILSKQDYYRSLEIKTKRHDPSALKELFESLDNGYFIMYLQPKARIIDEKIIGAEALVRISHPKYGLIYPGKFIPRLEEDGNIRYVDFYIFEEVCKTIRKWLDMGIEPIVISLNFSRSTILTENLIEMVQNAYEKYKVPKKYIEIEITESIGEIERDSIAQIGQQIVQQGYRLSLDDFGARYSNISVLSAMKLHVVKLDKSLVNDLTTNPSTRIVIGSFIQMCKQMDVESVAEGVETVEQLSILRDLECDLAQGYYFNKPIPLEDFEQRYMLK